MQSPSDQRASASGPRRAMVMRRTLTRHHGLRTKPLKTSICVDFSCAEWSDPAADLLSFDARVRDAEARALQGNTFVFRISGPMRALREVSKQVFTRYQRLFQRRNPGSRSRLFTEVLKRRRVLTQFESSVAEASCEHALDVWQWVLRLAPDASVALQLAALFHTTEARCPSCLDLDEPQRESADGSGAAALKALLEELEAPHALIVEATSRIVLHQASRARARDQNDLDGILLHDADTLSFLSQGDPSFLLSEENPRALHRVRQRVAQLSPSAQQWLPSIRLCPMLHELLHEALPAADCAIESPPNYGVPIPASAH